MTPVLDQEGTHQALMTVCMLVPHCLLSFMTLSFTRCCDVTSQHADFKTEFPSLFTGLGKVKTEVHITPQPDAPCAD